MRLVFFGTGAFAIPSLRVLAGGGHDVWMVVTQPDRAQGRGQDVGPPPVKRAAIKLGMPYCQPDRADDPKLLEILRRYEPECVVVVAYGQRLPSPLLALPARAAVNLHASLLPKYRGAAPVAWALMRGEVETGVTVIQMDDGIDTGPILSQRPVRIEDEDTGVTLAERLAGLGAELLRDTLRDVAEGRGRAVPQDEASATTARRLTKDDGVIRWTQPAPVIRNLVRAVVPWPGAFTGFRGRRCLLWRASVRPHGGSDPPGVVVSADEGQGLLVATGRDALRVEELQIEGGRRMEAAAFIAGHRPRAGESFELPDPGA